MRKGLIRAVFSLGALCLGFYGAFTFHDELSNELPSFIKYEELKTAASFVALFFAIYIPLILAGKGVRRLLRNIKLGWLDKILGLAFGGLKVLVDPNTPEMDPNDVVVHELYKRVREKGYVENFELKYGDETKYISGFFDPVSGRIIRTHEGFTKDTGDNSQSTLKTVKGSGQSNLPYMEAGPNTAPVGGKVPWWEHPNFASQERLTTEQQQEVDHYIATYG